MHAPVRNTTKALSGLELEDKSQEDCSGLDKSGSAHNSARGSNKGNNNTRSSAHALYTHDVDEGEDKLLPHEDDQPQTGWAAFFAKYNPLPHGGLASCGFNLASATLGAGTLAIPFAFASAGWLLGAFMLFSCMLATIYAIYILVLVYEKTGCHTFEEMSEKLVGKWLRYVTSFFIVAFCWGVTLIYVVAIGSILEHMQAFTWFPQGKWGLNGMVAAFWAVFMLPLSLMKEINSLRYASMLGMLSTAILVLAIVGHAFGSSKSSASHLVAVAPFSLDMIEALPTFTFGFCCQTNAFEIYTEMKRASPKRMTFASGLSMLACTLIYVVAGMGGMAEFGTEVKDNILNMYPDATKKFYLMIAFFGIALTVTLAFPICIFPTRDSIIQIIGYEDAYNTPAKVRIPICIALATASLILGILVPNMKLLFGVLGGLCGSSIAYILPGLFGIRSGVFDEGSRTFVLANKIGCWALLVGGVVFGALGTGVSLYQAFEPSKDSPPPPAHSVTRSVTFVATNLTEVMMSAVVNATAGGGK